MHMHPVKNIRTRGHKFYSHMYATEFRLLIYRISTINSGVTFITIAHQIEKMTDSKQKSLYHLQSVSKIWIVKTNTVFVFCAAISGYFAWKPVESCLDIKTIEGERAISGAYWLNQTGVIFQVKLVYNSMLFYYFWFSHSWHFYRPLSGFLVI